MAYASSSSRLAVIGAGAWGTVIALLLRRNGHEVRLWARRAEQAEAIAVQRENRERLPGVELPPGLMVTADIVSAVDGAEAVFLVVPSVATEEVVTRLPAIPALVSCSKGLAGPGLRTLSGAIAHHLPDTRLAVLSGPNLAGEIAAGLPAAAVAASTDEPLATQIQRWLQSTAFRVYTSPDPVGVEIGGAVKNIIALAAGMSDGLSLGENAKASIVTRGLAEMVRLGGTLGARRETLYGLAGLGDMVATCSSRGSRNHSAGERIAGGATLDELQRDGITAEGIPAVSAVQAFAEEHELPLPICSEVHRVIYERKDPREAIGDLMTRESRSEW